MNNDLISREALKEVFSDWHNWHTVIGYGKVVFLDKLFEIIDNAPTVAVNCKDCDGYEAGYSAGLKDADRPQGEWIRTGSLGNGNAHYECSNCHHGDEHAESQEVPYCWFCGADMRKGGAE